MAVAFRAAASGNAGGSALLTINVPAGTANGDIMIAVIVVSGAANTPNVPAGWTALDAESTGPSFRTYTRTALGEPANYTWTFTAGQSVSGVIASYSGAGSVDAHGAAHRTAASVTVTADSITTSAAGEMLVFAGAVGQAATFTGPTSFTQRSAPSGNGIAALIADMTQVSAGPTGAVTATSSISGNTDGSLISLAPGGAGAASDTVVIHQ